MRKALFLLFLRSLLVTNFDNLESGKKNCCFGKKVLIFGSKNQFTNPDFKSDVLAAVAIVDVKVCSINQVKISYSNVPANKLYNTGMRSVLEINNQ